MRRSATWVAGAWLLAILCQAPPSEAQPGPRDEWVRLRTENFELLTDGPERKARQIAEGLEQLRQIIAYIGTDVEAIRRIPITFVLFRSEDTLVPYLRTPPTRGTVSTWTGSYGDGRDYLLLNGSKPPEEVMPWAYSAYARRLIDFRYRDYPYWLRYGLSTFYGASEVDRRHNVRIGLPVRKHIQTLREHSMLPLEQLFRIDQGSEFLRHADNIRVFNAQTWALCHFFMTGGGEDVQRSRAFFTTITRGASPEEAIRSTFGVDLAAFESLLTAYVRQPSMPLFTLDGGFLTELEIEITPLDYLEMSYQLGYYLVIGHDPPPIALVEAHLEPVIASAGEHSADALAALAELRHRTGRDDRAAELFADAMTREPRVAASYYLAASFFAERSEIEPADVVRYLVRAVEIEPGFGEAWAKLGEAYDDDEGYLAEAIGALERAIELLPSRPDMPYNLAMLHLRQGDVDAAQSVVERHLRNEPRYLEPALEAIRRHRLVDTGQQAASSGDLDSAIETYRRAIAEATDAGLRAQMEADLERMEMAKRNQDHVDTYNRAVELANQGSYQEAVEVLEELLPQIEDVSLRTAANTLLTQLRPYAEQ